MFPAEALRLSVGASDSRAMRSVDPSQRFSVRLEQWLRDGEPKTLGALTRAFPEKSLAAAILILMLLPALPLPTGGISHLFEAAAVLLAAEMIIGRTTIWVPARWRDRPLGGVVSESAIPRVARWVRRVEVHSTPRAAWIFRRSWTLRLLGVLIALLTLAAAVAPPFSGLDTLPAIGAVAVCLAILLEDVAILAVGILIGAVGIALIGAVGASLAHLVGRLG